jgi:hypothetical protein
MHQPPLRALGTRFALGLSQGFTILDPLYGVLPYHVPKPLISDISSAPQATTRNTSI